MRPHQQPGPDPLGWIRVHLLNPVAITAAATVVLIFVPFIVWALDRRRPKRLGPSLKDRAVLLQRVRNSWISGVLEPSLADSERLDLGLHRRPDFIDNRNQAARRIHRPTAIHPGRTILQIFDEASGGLLILGAPGSGKTILLLQLAQELLDRASDIAEPIPVVADLSSWARPQPLVAWLTNEVAGRQYKIPSSAFSYWLARNKIILLLDGLDEVDPSQRDACVQAINVFRDEHGLAGIAVCCLTSEAEKLADHLELEEAIELEPPTDSQVDDYLRHMEAAGTPAADIRSAIEGDDDLRDLLRAPLMLHVVTRACQGVPGTVLRQPGNADERLHRLWDEYVVSMFQRRPVKGRKHAQQEIYWLEWLANALRDRSQTEFYLDRLALDWLPRGIRRRWEFLELSMILAEVLAERIGVGPIRGIYWSWAKLKSRFCSRPLAAATVISVCLGLPAAIGYRAAATGSSIPLVVSVMAIELCFNTLVVMAVGWGREQEGAQAAPNEGIRHSAVNGLVVGLPYATAFGLIFGMVDARIVKLGDPVIVGIITVLIALPFMGLEFGFGRCIAHYVVRALMAQSGTAPWRYRQFLETMTDRQLMRRSGGSYLFVHRLLRDHLADRAARRMSQARGTPPC